MKETKLDLKGIQEQNVEEGIRITCKSNMQVYVRT